MCGQGGVAATCQTTTLLDGTEPCPAPPGHANDRSLPPVVCQVLQPGTACSLSLCCGLYVGGFLLVEPALPPLLREQQENPGTGAAGSLSQAGDWLLCARAQSPPGSMETPAWAPQLPSGTGLTCPSTEPSKSHL